MSKGLPDTLKGDSRVKAVATALFLSLLCGGCARRKQEDFIIAHRYTLNGRVVSLNAKDQTASIVGAAIPNYMDAMTMDYPIKSKADFDRLRVGERIKATLNVNATSDEYNVTDIQDQGSGKK
jgi:Cu/Ag efflux protein CusF